MKALATVLVLAIAIAAAKEDTIENLKGQLPKARASYRENPDQDNRRALFQTLAELGILLNEKGGSEFALEHLREARDLAPDDQEKALVIHALGVAHLNLGQYRKAENLLNLALKTQTNSEDLRNTRFSLAYLHLRSSRPHQAGVLFQEILDSLPPEPSDLRAQAHSGLADYFHVVRRDELAESQYLESLKIYDSRYSRNDRRSITSRINLADFYHTTGQLEKAFELLREVSNDFIAPEDRDTLDLVVKAKNTLGLVLLDAASQSLELLSETDMRKLGTQFLREALADMEKLRGKDSPSLAPILLNLGWTEHRAGDFDSAQGHLENALSIFESIGTEGHLALDTQQGLALNRFFQGHRTEASEIARDCLTRYRRLVGWLASNGTERDRLRYLQNAQPFVLLDQCSPGDIANTLLNGKSLVQDGLIQQALDEAPSFKWQDLRQKLPPDCAYLDFTRYEHFTGHGQAEASYGAILLLPGQAPRWIKLGNEDSLLHLLDGLRDRLEYRSQVLAGEPSPSRPLLKLSFVLKKLHELIWTPIAAHLPEGISTLALCPDGLLSRISFATLMDEDGRFLHEAHSQVFYLASGRDLLRREREQSHWSSRPWEIHALSTLDLPSNASAGPNLDPMLVEFTRQLPDLAGAKEESSLISNLIAARNQVIPI